MGAFADVWARVTTPQPAPPSAVVLAAALVAVLLVVPRPVWRRTRHLVTIAHEGAHGLAAVLTGRRLGGIRLHRDTSGLTTSRGRTRGPGMVLTLAAGYPGPALAGLVGAWALADGWALAVLWATVVLLALVLVHVRNPFGVVTVVLTGAVVLAVSWWGSGEQAAAFAHVVVWFLLLAATRPVLELAAQRRRRPSPGSDVDQLAVLTHVPAVLWTGLFLLVAVGSLAVGTALLVPGVASAP